MTIVVVLLVIGYFIFRDVKSGAQDPAPTPRQRTPRVNTAPVERAARNYSARFQTATASPRPSERRAAWRR